VALILRLVKTGAEGDGQSTDVMEINRPDDLGHIAALGLSLAEAKLLLAGVQREFVAAQARAHAVRRPESRCGGCLCHVKDYRDHAIATLFGQVTVRLPRFRCAVQGCFRQRPAFLRQKPVRVLDRHRRIIDEDTDGQRQPAESHRVERMAKEIEDDERAEYGKRDRVAVDEVTHAAEGDYESLTTLSVETEAHERSVSGTVFHDGKPRIISINKIEVDALVAPTMIYVSNEDRPGFIGRFASILGNAEVNIATFALGRDREGGSAVALVEVDGVLLDTILAEVKTLPGVKDVKALAF
jgi:hypothetical protein